MFRLFLCAAAVALLAAPPVQAFCGCRPTRVPHCADKDAKHRMTLRIELAVQDGTVELLTQTGLFRAPAADFDGKPLFAVFLNKGEVFQGFLEEALTIVGGNMTGTTAEVTTDAVFPPGEYEMLLFVDVTPGGGLGPQHGDIAAFDNTTCNPTGVSVRFAVGCEDTTVTVQNKHFILF